MQRARDLARGFGERFEDVKFLIRDRGSNLAASSVRQQCRTPVQSPARLTPV